MCSSSWVGLWCIVSHQIYKCAILFLSLPAHFHHLLNEGVPMPVQTGAQIPFLIITYAAIGNCNISHDGSTCMCIQLVYKHVSLDWHSVSFKYWLRRRVPYSSVTTYTMFIPMYMYMYMYMCIPVNISTRWHSKKWKSSVVFGCSTPGLIIVMSEALGDDSLFSLLMVATVWEADQFFAVFCRHHISKTFFPM